MKVFQVFLPLKEPLLATLNETCALTSAINVAKKGMTILNLSETLRFVCPKSKKEECDQMDLNVSDQFERLTPFSTTYFLEMRTRLLQKLATENSSIGKKNFVFSGGVRTHFSLKVANKDSVRYKKVKKLLFLTPKFYKPDQRSASKIIYFSDYFRTFLPSSAKHFLRVSAQASLEVPTKCF